MLLHNGVSVQSLSLCMQWGLKVGSVNHLATSQQTDQQRSLNLPTQLCTHVHTVEHT